MLVTTAKPKAENIHMLFSFSFCPHWAHEVKTIELLLYVVERCMEQDLITCCNHADSAFVGTVLLLSTVLA